MSSFEVPVQRSKVQVMSASSDGQGRLRVHRTPDGQTMLVFDDSDGGFTVTAGFALDPEEAEKLGNFLLGKTP
jgi:hypothetical protein